MKMKISAKKRTAAMKQMGGDEAETNRQIKQRQGHDQMHNKTEALERKYNPHCTAAHVCWVPCLPWANAFNNCGFAIYCYYNHYYFYN